MPMGACPFLREYGGGGVKGSRGRREGRGGCGQDVSKSINIFLKDREKRETVRSTFHKSEFG